MTGGAAGPRRIAVCHVIHSLQPGGAEDALVTLARFRKEADLDLTVVSLLPASGHPVAESLRAEGVPVTSLALSGKWDPRAFRLGVRAIRVAAPDVIHTHLKHADVIGAVAARRLRLPMISTTHTIDEHGGVTRRARRHVALAVRRRVATTTITVSEAQRGWYLRALGGDPGRVITVHNGVPSPATLTAPERKALRRSFGVEPGELMATMVGIMRPGKGHADLLALARAAGRDAGVRFVLAGDGALRPGLEATFAEQRAASAPVVFAGFRADAPSVVAASDLVVHPSRQEALPTALLHALAAGRPILATEVGGIPEIVTEEAGILVPPGDVARLLDALRRLRDDDDLRRHLGAGARRRFEEEFDASVWVRRLRRVYEEVLGSRDIGQDGAHAEDADSGRVAVPVGTDPPGR